MTMRRQAGLTLIELMVAILLAAILSAGLFYMTAGQTATYDSQLKNVTLQQNLWAAMEYLQRQVRMAGFGIGGCPNGGEIKAYDSGATGGIGHATEAFKVYNDCSLYKTTPCSGNAGVDSLTVDYSTLSFGGNLPAVRITGLVGSSGKYWVDSCTGLSTSDWVVIWEPVSGATPPKSCVLMQITNVQPTGNGNGRCKVEFDPGVGINPPSDTHALYGGGFGIGALIVRVDKNLGSTSPTTLNPLHFAIDVDHDPPRLMQWRKADKSDAQVVADGIEDMQIAWACDFNSGTGDIPTGMVTGSGADQIFYEGNASSNRQKDEWFSNVASDNEPSCYLNTPVGCTVGTNCRKAPVGIVRITLVARTPAQELGKNQAPRPAIEDRGAATSNDNYQRAVLTTIVKPRNLR
jgi:prepilin-type N-terminal cleavage/methylation domain-containing protein